MTSRWRCRWCDRPIEVVKVPGLEGERPLDPPTCRRCKVPLCDPVLRDCAFQHWKFTHDERTIKRTTAPGYRKIQDVKTEAV